MDILYWFFKRTQQFWTLPVAVDIRVDGVSGKSRIAGNTGRIKCCSDWPWPLMIKNWKQK